MRPTRPDRYTQPEPEDLFNVTVSFKDDEPDIIVTEVEESDLVGMYQHLGDDGARMRLQPRPGFHYMTAVSRIKHITAELINETSN
jgi:hypothetical protein